MRRPLSHNLFFDYGATGSYSFASETTYTVKPYQFGAFIGLSWHALPNFMIAAKILPYLYDNSYDKSKHTRVFADGSISISYLF